MRPLTFEEREDLIRRSNGEDLLSFVASLQELGRSYKLTHRELLSILLHAPQPTDIPDSVLLAIRYKLAEEGTELTPDEVTSTIESALCKIRNSLRDAGLAIPDTDTGLIKLFVRLL